MELTSNKVYAVRVWKLESTGRTNQELGKSHPQFAPSVTSRIDLYDDLFNHYTVGVYNRNGSKTIAIFKIYPKFDFTINC